MTLLLVVLMGCTKSAAQESLQLDAGDEEPVSSQYNHAKVELPV